MKARLSTMLLVLGAVTLSHHSAADEPKSKVKPGERIVDHPITLINLGFEWLIEGDDSRNANLMCSTAEMQIFSESTASAPFDSVGARLYSY